MEELVHWKNSLIWESWKLMSRLMMEPECVTAFENYVTIMVNYVYWAVVIGKEPSQSL